MRTILKQVLITPRNCLRVAALIVPQDQRAAIRPGIIISHYAFTNSQGQHGYAIVSHTTQRAGICCSQGCSEWGRWSEATGTITTDSGRMYNRIGEAPIAVGEQGLEQIEAS
jgi:hypothetical protein